jgi:protein-disulfide isomerase
MLSARSERVRLGLDAITSIVLIVAACILAYTALRGQAGPSQRTTIELPQQPFAIGNAPSRGSPTAQYVLVEFSDFQCPFCAKFVREVLP